MSHLTEMLRTFNKKYDRPSRSVPTSDLPSDEVTSIMRKLSEEVGELQTAIEGSDIVDIADGLADSVYVLAGMADQFGLDLDILLNVVHESNMTKELRHGVPTKGRSYRRPAIKKALTTMRDNAVRNESATEFD